MVKSPTDTTTEEYRTLEFPVTQGQFTYRLLKRTGRVCLIDQTNTQSGHHYAYEVWVIQQRPEAKFPGGRITPAREAMPSDEQWGTFAWTVTDLERAQERFDGVVEEVTKSKDALSKGITPLYKRGRKGTEGDHSGQGVKASPLGVVLV